MWLFFRYSNNRYDYYFGFVVNSLLQSSIETNDVLDVEFVSCSNHFTFKVNGCGKENYNYQARTQATNLFKS